MEAHAGVCVCLCVFVCAGRVCGVCVKGGCDRWGFEVGVGLGEGEGRKGGREGGRKYYTTYLG
jgi:hypothetical protein